MDRTSRITVKSVADHWKQQYCKQDGWRTILSGYTKDIYDKILLCKTFDQVDKAIGNDTWTKAMCNECRVSTRKPMISFNISSGEYSHTIGRACLDKALKLIG